MIILSENILFEIKLNDLQKRYPRIEDNILNQIFKADPTGGKYAGWLAIIYSLKKLKLEDLYKATEYLEIYDKIKKKLPVEYRDINRFKKERITYIDNRNGKKIEKEKIIKTPIISSLQDLYQLIKPYQEKDEHLTKNEKIEKENLIATIGKWKIYKPKTYEASCYLGSGTQWCTATGNTDLYYDNYTQQGDLIIIINSQNKGEKYQFHFESGQFMDENDEKIDLDIFFSNNPELAAFIDKLYGKKTLIYNFKENGINIKKKNNIFILMFKNIDVILNITGNTKINKILRQDANYDIVSDYFYNVESVENILNYMNMSNLNKVKIYLKENTPTNEKFDIEEELKRDKKLFAYLSDIYKETNMLILREEAWGEIASYYKGYMGINLKNFKDTYIGTTTQKSLLAIYQNLFGYNHSSHYFFIEFNEPFFIKKYNKLLNEKLYDFLKF